MAEHKYRGSIKYPAYKYILALADWCTINSAFIFAVLVRAQFQREIIAEGFPFLPPDILAMMAISSLCLLLLQYNNLYKINIVLTIADQLTRLIKSTFYMIVGLVVLSFFTKSFLITDSRLVMLYFGVFSILFLGITRLMIFHNVFKLLAYYRLYQRRVLIVGAGKIGRMLAANLSLNNPYGIQIHGFVDNVHAVGAPIFRGLKVIGTFDDIEYLAGEYVIDEIIICEEELAAEQTADILERCRQTRAQVKIASPLHDLVPSFRFTEKYGQIPLIGLSHSAPTQMQELYKKIFDTVLAMFGVVLFMPLFIIIAVATKLDSSGPVLYRQVRIGKNGKPFMFYKFRSMYVGSDRDFSRRERFADLIQSKSQNGIGSTKIVDESKITYVGKFIRKTSLDELPQLLNVIKGEMSLVGPRPCLPYEWQHYENWHKKRLSIMPGCTGVWQVSGRSSVGFNDMVFLDLYYIQNKSFFLDLQLIFKTIPVMVFGRGGK